MREIIRLMRTSASQVYRLLDPVNQVTVRDRKGWHDPLASSAGAQADQPSRRFTNLFALSFTFSLTLTAVREQT